MSFWLCNQSVTAGLKQPSWPHWPLLVYSDIDMVIWSADCGQGEVTECKNGQVIYLSIYLYIYTHMYIRLNTSIYTVAAILKCDSKWIYIYIYKPVGKSCYNYVCIYIYLSIYLSIYIYIYIYMVLPSSSANPDGFVLYIYIYVQCTEDCGNRSMVQQVCYF